MSVTIDSLDIQIKSSAGSAAKNIDELAKALSNLNASSSVTKTVNALNKLNTALSSMSGHQSVMTHLTALSHSLAGLAAVPKLTGLQSAIRELKKLPEVMKSLNTSEISQFANKMKSLADGLSPLATQIEKIGRGFSKLPPQVSKCVTAVKRLDSANKSVTKSTKEHGAALNSQSVNFLAAYENLTNVFEIIHGIQEAFAKVLQDAIQWDGIQYQFGRAFGEDAEMVLDYAEKVSEALKINKQQFMESASLYGSLLKGFGVEQKQVTTMAVGLAELSYDIWAAYNNRYRTLEDASEAVRSAITGEIEPIRNAGIALTEASMQEYLESVGMAHVSIEKLTEAQKSEVRYAAMVNAAMQQGIIGTYAREMNTAEGAVRTLTQQLKTLGQAFGSLFIPVLKAVIPWLTAFVELLTEGLITLGALFGYEFQEITWAKDTAAGMAQAADGANATQSALGDAAKEAKKLKDYALGFDELNVISPDSGSDSSGSGGSGGGAGGIGAGDSLGLDLDTLWNDSILAKAKEDVEGLKEKLKEMLGIAGDIAIVIGSWMVAGKLLSFVEWLKDPKSIGDFKRKAGLSLMIAGVAFEFDGAYDIGLNGANAKNVLKTAIGAAMGIAGSLLLFGTGPAGWAIGVGTALTVLITGLTLGTMKKNLLEDQAEHFGEYVLSKEELEEMVKDLTTTETTMRLDLYVDQNVIVSDTKKALEEAMTELRKLNLKLDIGLEVSQETYAAAVDKLLDSVSAYFTEKQLEYALAIDVTLNDTDTGKRLTEFSNSFFLESQGKLTELGNKLKTVVSEGFTDGEWIPEKLKEAIELQKEIQEVLEYVSDKEFQAKMSALKLDASGTALSFESMEELLDQASETITEKMKNLEEVRLQQIQIAQMEFDQNVLDGMSEAEAQKILDTTLEDIQEAFLNSKMELNMGPVTFGLDTITDAYSKELKKIEPIMQQSTEELFIQGTMAVLPGTTYDNIGVLMNQLRDAFTYGFEDADISGATRKNVEELLVAMKPTLADIEEVAAEARKAGKTVPEEVSKGLSDAAQLAALTGDIASINYLIGKQLSTDDSFLDMLATAEDAGAQIPPTMASGLLDNVKIIYDDVSGTMTGIENTITGKVTEMTPVMYQNMKDLGVELPAGLYEGADSELKSQESSWKDWAIWPWNWFKKANDINSPSGLFKDGGMYIAQGLLKGVDENTEETEYTDIYGRLNTWFKDAFGISGSKSSVFSTFGSALGGSLKTAISAKWDEIKSWYSNSVAPKFTLSFWLDKFKNLKEGFTQTIKNMLNTGIEMFNKFIGWLNEKLRFEWEAITIMGKTIVPAGSVQLFTIPLITQRFADGGFIEDGLFTMNHGEIAGKFTNGKSVVANNQQIVEGIAAGVYQAVVAAMSATNNRGEQNVNVYLDGKQIYASVKKTESERGVSLMGNQLGYVY